MSPVCPAFSGGLFLWCRGGLTRRVRDMYAIYNMMAVYNAIKLLIIHIQPQGNNIVCATVI